MASAVVRQGGCALASFPGPAEQVHRPSPSSVAVKSFALDSSWTPLRAARARRHPPAAVAGAAAPSSAFYVDQATASRRDDLVTDLIRINRVEESRASEELSADLDSWIKCSVTEIVRNVGEAPLLVQIFSDEGEGGGHSSNAGGVRLETERAVPENWPRIKGRWEGGSRKAPNGIILVEELPSSDGESSNRREESSSSSELHCSATKVWGLLIQGRGGKDGGACYLLKTCTVASVLGFCTHFCLARVDCFAESAELQLQKLWLQRRVGADVPSP